MKTIIVNNAGPQGPRGPIGPSGSSPVLPSGLISSSGQFTDITSPFTGSFTGSFAGDGSNLINVPASGVVGLNLSRISDGSATASISDTTGLFINTNVTASIFSGSFVGDGSGLLNVTAPGTLSGSAQIATEISGAFGASSASFSTRISANEAVTAKTLISGSSQIASSISGSFGAPSASFSTRVTTNETNITNLQTDSGSFSTRVTTNETAITTLNASGLLSSSRQIANDISGSLGSNAVLIRSLDAHVISGSFTAPSASIALDIIGNKDLIDSNAGNISINNSNISSNRALITGITSSLSTTGRMVFVGANGTLTSEAGFEYNATTNQLSVDNLNVNHLTSSFITSSQIVTSGSNIFGDDTTDTQTLIGTTKISGSAQITGATQITGSLTISGSFNAFTLDSDNIVLGKGAGADMLAGANNNTIIGPNAGANLTTGDNNVFLGQNAGAGITNYHYNTAIGYYAMGSTSDASTYNVAVGYTALRYGSGVQGNIGIGYQALQGVGGMNGDYNIGIGYGAGDVIRDGLNNVFVGKHAGGSINDGDSNIAIGITAGNKITDGNDNICIGNLAGRNLVTGTGNIILGTSASLASDLNGMLVIGSGSLATISASLATGNILLQGDISSSATSTASFGTYVGDGSQLSGISTTPFPFSGSAVITGSLTVSQSIVDFSNASSVVLPAATQPLINPEVRYFTTTVITGSGTTVPIPGGLTFISSSIYEYLEIFINGLRLRYDIDFTPMSTASVQYNFALPVGSEITYKSLKRP